MWLDSHLLDDLVLVDTPGLFSPNDERSARARDLVRGQTGGAADAADAVLYVTSEAPGAKREAAELDAFAALFPDLGHAPTNALIVMTKADRYWPGSADPLATAAGALDSARAAWRSRAWQAIPVAALLADVALDAADVEALARVAGGEREIDSRSGCSPRAPAPAGRPSAKPRSYAGSARSASRSRPAPSPTAANRSPRCAPRRASRRSAPPSTACSARGRRRCARTACCASSRRSRSGAL